jgi:hypothetical protein
LQGRMRIKSFHDVASFNLKSEAGRIRISDLKEF